MAERIIDPLGDYTRQTRDIDPQKLQQLLKERYPQPVPAGQQLAGPEVEWRARMELKQSIIKNAEAEERRRNQLPTPR